MILGCHVNTYDNDKLANLGSSLPQPSITHLDSAYFLKSNNGLVINAMNPGQT